MIPGTVNHCVELLADNNLIGIAPGEEEEDEEEEEKAEEE